jgi:hypothetical protein
LRQSPVVFVASAGERRSAPLGGREEFVGDGECGVSSARCVWTGEMLAGEVAIAAVVPNDDEVAGVDAAGRKFRCLEQ